MSLFHVAVIWFKRSYLIQIITLLLFLHYHLLFVLCWTMGIMQIKMFIFIWVVANQEFRQFLYCTKTSVDVLNAPLLPLTSESREKQLSHLERNGRSSKNLKIKNNKSAIKRKKTKFIGKKTQWCVKQ